MVSGVGNSNTEHTKKEKRLTGQYLAQDAFMYYIQHLGREVIIQIKLSLNIIPKANLMIYHDSFFTANLFAAKSTTLSPPWNS